MVLFTALSSRYDSSKSTIVTDLERTDLTQSDGLLHFTWDKIDNCTRHSAPSMLLIPLTYSIHRPVYIRILVPSMSLITTQIVRF